MATLHSCGRLFESTGGLN